MKGRYKIIKYLRISSEDIDLDGFVKYESNSIINQRAFLDDFIHHMPESADCEIFEAVDDGRTGTNFNRPGILRVLELAQCGKIHCIIVKDLSRFGRNYLEVGDYLEQLLPAWGIRFISVSDMYDSAYLGGMTGGISMAFRSLIAQMYSQDLSEKVRSAKDTLNRSGKSCAPYGFYGYLIDSNDRHKLMVDEPAAEIVRLIYNLYEQGMSMKKIAHKLNADGIQTASERKQEQGAKRIWLRNSKVNLWDTSIISIILRDERYTGKHIYGKKRRRELGIRNLEAKPQSEWIVVPDAVPMVITADQFGRIRELLHTKKGVQRTNLVVSTVPALFQRKIFCGACGRALTRQKRSGSNDIYCCRTSRLKQNEGCLIGSIHESDVTAAVLTVIKQQTALAEKMRVLAGKKSKVSSSMLNSLFKEGQSIQRKIEKTNSEKLMLWEKLNNSEISLDNFKAESEKLAARAAAYAAQAARLEDQISALRAESGQENVFPERFSKQAGIEEVTKGIVDEFIKGIYVYTPDRIEIVLNYMDEFLSL